MRNMCSRLGKLLHLVSCRLPVVLDSSVSPFSDCTHPVFILSPIIYHHKHVDACKNWCVIDNNNAKSFHLSMKTLRSFLRSFMSFKKKKTLGGVQLSENYPWWRAMMRANMKQSYCYFPDVIYFPITACFQVFYCSDTTAICQRMTHHTFY